MQNFILAILTFICVAKSLSAQDLNLASYISDVSPQSKFRLDSFMVWCGSMVKGDDGRYYLYYSRWPRSKGHMAWVTHSEIAVAVSDHPTGPYAHNSVVLPTRKGKYWDADVTHNPTIHKFGNTYYLYYMGNYGNGEWWDHRNHQRIGVAISKSPLGPWKRSDRPLVDTTSDGFDHLIASNPSIMKRLDGKFEMIYKGVSRGPMPFGGSVTHGAAIADKPEGPFIKTNHKIFTKDSVKFAAEDPYIWAQDGKYWAIVKDMNGYFTGAGTSLALFESTNGFDWTLAKHPLVATTQIRWKSGVKKVQKLERPQLWMENGQPKVLFCAVYDGDDNYNIAIPLEQPASATASKMLKDGYVLLYEDDFSGTKINLNDWQFRTGRRTGMGYMEGLNLPGNVYLKDSALHINVRHEQINGKWENTGGGIIGKHNFGYGYYETLSKPFMEGHGVHTSFWQRGGSNPNNNIFEIDSYEIDSKTRVATNNLYVDLPYQGYSYTPWPHRAQIPFKFRNDGWFLDAYEFTPEGVVFYDNDKIVAKAEYNELNARQVVWLTALNGVGKVDSSKLPGESVFKYFRYYAKDYPGYNLLPNGNFEFNQNKTDPAKPIAWDISGDSSSVLIMQEDAARDKYRLRVGMGHKHRVGLSQTLKYLRNGSYQLSFYAKSLSNPTTANIVISEHGSEKIIYPIKASAEWKKMTIPDIRLSSNQVTISIQVQGDDRQWLEFDNIQFIKPRIKDIIPNAEKQVPQETLPVWSIALRNPITFIGDQTFYFFDRNVGIGDSMSIHFVMKADQLANTTPIARIPKTGQSGWSIQTTADGALIFRIGSIESHEDIKVADMYKPGQTVEIGLVKQSRDVLIYKNTRLVWKYKLLGHDTNDATAAGRLGTVGTEFEAVGEVVMQSSERETESTAMKNFRGVIEKLRIYNRAAHQ